MARSTLREGYVLIGDINASHTPLNLGAILGTGDGIVNAAVG